MKKIILPTVLFTLACVAQAATIEVNSDSNDVNPGGGACTLRGAVDSINSGGANANGCSNSASDGYGTNDTIKFAAGMTINVTVTGGIVIKKDLTIIGVKNISEQPIITLNGGDSNRIFNVANTVSTLTITDVEFIKGYSDDYLGGGAILFRNANGTLATLLTLENCVFEGNLADSNGPYGGAVYAGTVDGDIAINISNSTFYNNEARDSTGDLSGYGGAVYADAGGNNGYIAINISNSTFTDNKAGTNLGNSGGGAVFFQGSGDSAINISNSTFTRNTGGTGGAVRAETGVLVIISNSTFSNNEAINISNSGTGGAVSVIGASDTDTVISNSTFSGNTSGGTGGAVYVLASSDTVISNSTFSGNETVSGGAVYAVRTNAHISNSTFFSNKATNGNGGAVFITGNNTLTGAGTLTAHHLTLLNNSAGGDGQALYLYATSGSGHSISLHNSIIIGNNSGDQCVNNSAGSIAGSYNLEGWDNGATTDPLQGTNTCNTSNLVSDGGATPNAIITTPLADNGSVRSPLTQTLALPAGSPAIAAADPGGSQMLKIDSSQSPPSWEWVDATEDQRGYGRAANSDERSIGAYERGGTPPSPPTPPSGSGTPIPALPVPLLLALAALVGTAAAARQRRR